MGSSSVSCGGGISVGHDKTEICVMSEVILPQTMMLIRLLVSTIGGLIWQSNTLSERDRL